LATAAADGKDLLIDAFYEQESEKEKNPNKLI
jgi:hypothetical protein